MFNITKQGIQGLTFQLGALHQREPFTFLHFQRETYIMCGFSPAMMRAGQTFAQNVGACILHIGSTPIFLYLDL